jgi:hypothetical protein
MLENLELDTNFSQILEFNDGDFLYKMNPMHGVMVKKDPIGGHVDFL